jgi:C_GCAxxG_C_C family probable redox protein
MDTINGLTKEKAMEKAFRTAYEGEANRTNCAQETFHAITSVLGIKNPQLFKSLSALEAGGAITTEGSCGAFSGGLVAISHFFGRDYDKWQEGKPYIKSSVLGQKLYKKFKEEYDTVICREIHKKKYGRTFNLMDRENLGIDMDELKEFEAMGAHENMCTTVAGLSAMWVIDILWDELPKDVDISEMPTPEQAKKDFKPKK